MGAFAEARYFAWERVAPDQRFPIKGKSLSPDEILGLPGWAEPFVGGPVLLARLAPVDYHHVHYPDHGTTLRHHHVGGRLWTVNWHALLAQDDILFRNEREVQIVKTDNFGQLAFVEIGAMSVGRIVQVHPLDQSFARGAEKSFFKFGGSQPLWYWRAGEVDAEARLRAAYEGVHRDSCAAGRHNCYGVVRSREERSSGW